MKTVLVLGAGTGGVAAAKALSRLSGNEEDIQLLKILLFEKEDRSLYSPSLPWVMVGKSKPKEISRRIGNLGAPGLDIIQGEIEAIDPENITLSCGGVQYRGDHMVIALGVKQVSDPYLEQFGHNFFTLKGAENFYAALQDFDGGEIAVVVSSLPFKSPAAPYEAAMLIEDYVRQKKLRKNTTVSLFTPEAGPMEHLGTEAFEELRELLEKKGIRYYPNHRLTSASEDVLKFSNGKTYSYDLLAYTPKHELPEVVKNSRLAGGSGWVEVDEETLETKFKNVYAIGDITQIINSSGAALPKIGVFARQQAEVVARNIIRKPANQKPDHTFLPAGKYFIETGEGKACEAVSQIQLSKNNASAMKTPGRWGHFSKWWEEKFWFLKNF